MEKNEITKVLEGLKNLQDGGTVKDSELLHTLRHNTDISFLRSS